MPNSTFEVIDFDELEQGLTQQHITLSQYTLAQREATHLLQLLKQGKFELLETTKQNYQELVIDK